jgi:hypothetical protein
MLWNVPRLLAVNSMVGRCGDPGPWPGQHSDASEDPSMDATIDL